MSDPISPPLAEAQTQGPPATFRQAYGVLRGHAQSLRDQREPNIDDLLRIVEESVQAYQVCKQRIDAVERALEQTLAGAQDGKLTQGDAPSQQGQG